MIKLFGAEINILKDDGMEIRKVCHVVSIHRKCHSLCAQADVKVEEIVYRNPRTHRVVGSEKQELILIFTCKATGHKHSFKVSEMSKEHQKIIAELTEEKNNE